MEANDALGKSGFLASRAGIAIEMRAPSFFGTFEEEIPLALSSTTELRVKKFKALVNTCPGACHTDVTSLWFCSDQIAHRNVDRLNNARSLRSNILS